ncbi:Pantothenate kinase 4 [Schistosoma japonicum]|nr:Pantothenate kinase 4 [Schistosoma japonicum]
MSYASAVDLSQVSDPSFDHDDNENIFALDIGGSLAKLVYKRVFRYRRSVPQQCRINFNESDLPFDFYEYAEHEDKGQKLCFMKFETRNIEECLDFICSNIIQQGALPKRVFNKIKVTGGGAYRYRELICSKLGVELDKEDEMDCLIRGCIFMLRNIPDELFYYDKHATPAHVFVSNCLVSTFPFLLVNVGSGVSFLKVESPTSYQRVGGTSIGGGTFWGLGTLLSGGKFTFDELLEMADSGDHRHIDMLVRDIYGGAYDALGLSGDVIASSFGLAARHPEQPRALADMVKSLLITVSNNIGQLACLYAKQHNLTRIIFGGYFIRGHGLTMEVITYAVRFWSGGEYKALFLRHEGYLGAIGAFLKTFENNNSTERKALWSENYVVSSSNTSFCDNVESKPHGINHSNKETKVSPYDAAVANFPVFDVSGAKPVVTSQKTGEGKPIVTGTLNHTVQKHEISGLYNFELDRVFAHSLEMFHLLESPANYSPDTWDLTHDEEARIYWLSCFDNCIEYHREKAEESQSDTLSDAADRSNQFAERYKRFLCELSADPSGRGVLTVRCLLSAQQHFLREYGFGDVFCLQKRCENRAALSALTDRLSELSKLSWPDRQLSLIQGLLAGNMFDWGASEAVQFLNKAPQNKFGVVDFHVTLNKVQARPWLVDDYDKWIDRISVSGSPYRCILIFCDNSGADIILGVLPFAMEFLRRGSKVIMAANSITSRFYSNIYILQNKLMQFKSWYTVESYFKLNRIYDDDYRRLTKLL